MFPVNPVQMMGQIPQKPSDAQQQPVPSNDAVKADFMSAIQGVQSLAQTYPHVATQINQALQLLLETMTNAAQMTKDPGSQAAAPPSPSNLGVGGRIPPGPQDNMRNLMGNYSS